MDRSCRTVVYCYRNVVALLLEDRYRNVIALLLQDRYRNVVTLLLQDHTVFTLQVRCLVILGCVSNWWSDDLVALTLPWLPYIPAMSWLTITIIYLSQMIQFNLWYIPTTTFPIKENCDTLQRSRILASPLWKEISSLDHGSISFRLLILKLDFR